LTHNFSLEQTALAVRRSKGSVFNICNGFTSSGLNWLLDPELTDDQLEVALFPPLSHPKKTSSSTPPLPDIGYIEQELASKGVPCYIRAKPITKTVFSHNFPNALIIELTFIRCPPRAKQPPREPVVAPQGRCIFFGAGNR
jgi:hypothetical protein